MTNIPKKIDIVEKATVTVYGNGLQNAPTTSHVSFERGLIHLNDKINEIIDYLEESKSND